MRCMGSQKITFRDSNLFFVNCSTLSVAYFLADSSPFIILPGISAPVVIFHATARKELPYLFKLPKVLLLVLGVI